MEPRVDSTRCSGRVTVACLVIVGLVSLQTLRLSGRRTDQPEAPKQRLGKIEVKGCVHEEPVQIAPSNGKSLTDITELVGLSFRHLVGPVGSYFMPESVGAGGALHDFDGDGRLDIYLLNGGRSPDSPGEFPAGARLGNRLFRQTETGQFVDITDESGLGDDNWGFGCAVGDVDNDGDVDVLVTKYGSAKLFLNDGACHFTDETQRSGVHNPEWGSCAAFFDYNRDGWLDLMIVNYTRDPNHGHSVACGFPGGLVSYCGPFRFLPTIDRLFCSDGLVKDESGQEVVHFTDISEAAGFYEYPTFGFGVICTDFTGDGWPDIFIANDGAPNRLWVNLRDGRFSEEGAERGAAFNGRGSAEAGMGVAVGDVNHDGRPEILVTHLTSETSTLYTVHEHGLFEDITIRAGVDRPTRKHTGWGTAFLDLNHDGLLDVPIVNGLVVPCHSKFPPHGEAKMLRRIDVVEDSQKYWQEFADRNVLLLGSGTWSFRDASREGGDFCRAIGSARSLIYGDTDNDGDVDLLVTNCGAEARLYRNDFPKKGNWLTVRTTDPKRRRDAYGARVRVRVDQRWFHGLASPVGSYLASNDVRVHLGLGPAARYDELVVEWPDGPVESASEVYPGGPTNQHVVVQRGSGHPMKGRK